jgi:hypothetical protein
MENQAKALYMPGENSLSCAISRANKQPTAPLKPTGTFHANEPSGSACDNTGQSKPCPDRKAMYNACKKKKVEYRTNTSSARTNQMSNAASAMADRPPTARAIMRA